MHFPFGQKRAKMAEMPPVEPECVATSCLYDAPISAL